MCEDGMGRCGAGIEKIYKKLMMECRLKINVLEYMCGVIRGVELVVWLSKAWSWDRKDIREVNDGV